MLDSLAHELQEPGEDAVGEFVDAFRERRLVAAEPATDASQRGRAVSCRNIVLKRVMVLMGQVEHGEGRQFDVVVNDALNERVQVRSRHRSTIERFDRKRRHR